MKSVKGWLQRTIGGAIGAMGFVLVGVGSASGQAAEPRPQMAEEVFKNVTVLKGIPVDEFMDTMGMFSAALSLNCSDCHLTDSWAKFGDDTPLKRTARRMMAMVNTINSANFAGTRTVSCYTCHHGQSKPNNVPSLTLQYSEAMEDPNEVVILPDAQGPSADSVFDKYIQALGGAERVNSLTSFAAKGTYSGYDTDLTQVPVEIFAKAPDQRSTIVHLASGDSVRTFDGRTGWVASPDKPTLLMPLTGGNLEGAKLDAIASFPAVLKQAFSQWRVGTAAIDEHLVQVVQGTTAGRPPMNLYFDQSGLLVRLLRYVDTAVGRVPTQIDYSDYRDVGGVKIPFRWIMTWTDGQTTTQLSEVQSNIPVDAAKFARPAPAPPPKLQ